MMLTPVADATAEEATLAAGTQGDLPGAASLTLSHRILPTGEAVTDIGGELDSATAEMAVRYVSHVVDRHSGPVIVDLTALRFCGAQGLSAFMRMASYAKQAGCPFRLISPSPPLVKILRITGLDRKFLAPLPGCMPDS